MDELELNFGGLELNFEIETDFDTKKRVKAPKRVKSIKPININFDNAVQFAKKLKVSKGERFFSFLAGNFIFGDVFEAFAVDKEYFIEELNISTLSLSQENVDSFRNLIEWGVIGKLNLIVSDFFFAHERHNLVPYMYDQLDINNCFQLAVSRTHTKLALMKTTCGMHFVFKGSANLRSSDNLEFVEVEDNAELFRYIKGVHDEIIREYKTINKSIKSKKLWQVVQMAKQENKH